MHGFSVQFQFIHRMRLILNIMFRRCIIHGWLSNANDTFRNTRERVSGSFRPRRKIRERAKDGTSLFTFAARRRRKAKSSALFCYAGTREHEKESLRRYTRSGGAAAGYPVIAARRTNIPPGVLRQDFPLSWRAEGVPRSIPRSHFREIRMG